jgi:hypothetical protein
MPACFPTLMASEAWRILDAAPAWNEPSPWIDHAERGDLVQGSPVSTVFQGVPDYEIANSLASTSTAWETTNSITAGKRIRDFLQAANFATVNANVVDTAGNRMLNPPYVIREAGGMRIAVIGALLEHLLEHTTQQNLGPYHSAPLVETLRPVVAEAKQQADICDRAGALGKDGGGSDPARAAGGGVSS